MHIRLLIRCPVGALHYFRRCARTSLACKCQARDALCLTSIFCELYSYKYWALEVLRATFRVSIIINSDLVAGCLEVVHMKETPYYAASLAISWQLCTGRSLVRWKPCPSCLSEKTRGIWPCRLQIIVMCSNAMKISEGVVPGVQLDMMQNGT